MFYIIFVTLFLFVSNNPVIAEETAGTETFQGVVSSTEGGTRYLIINEKRVLLSDNLEVKDHSEREIELSDIRVGKWVYVVAERRAAGITARRIYLLPKKITNREKHEYRFMEREEETE